MVSVRSKSIARLWKAIPLVAAFVAAATCGDQSTTDPSGSVSPGHARLAVAPRFSTLPDGAPSIPLATVEGVLTDSHGNKFTVTAHFVDGVATLEFDVQFTGLSADFTLDLTAFDQNGVVAYHASQALTLKPGDNPNVPSPVLVYAAPDAAVTALHVSPASMVLPAGGAGAVSATGTNASGQPVTPLRVGWTSRNSAIATVDDNGNVKAGNSQGQTYIVGRTANNSADSALVKVHAPVAQVVVKPTTAEIIRGQSTGLTAQLFDAGGNLIDDRVATWTTSDASVATVSVNGSVTGVKIGTATITATAEGKTATTGITVSSPLDHVEFTPGTVNLASLHQTQALVTKLVPKTGASVDGITPTYKSSDPTIVSVDATGTVTALKNGSATITVTADDKTAAVNVIVKQVAATVTISPKTYSVTSVGDSRTFTATVLDALGSEIVNANVTWVAGDPTVAGVSGGGNVVALKSGASSITATSDGKSDVATFIVAPTPKLLAVILSKTKIQVNETSQATAMLADANGTPISQASAAWSTTTPNVITVSAAGVVTGVSAGVGHIVANAGAFTGSADVTVTGGTGNTGGLVLNVSSVEKLPHGTQEFFVVSGGEGPFTWTVNGIPNGNSTFGTIVVDGSAFYTAPASVPSPSTFDVCAVQASPAATGCAHVTISPIPSGGADVIVFNDINTFDSPGYSDVNNQLMFRNLVSFTGSGPRTSQTSVMMFNGHNSNYELTSSSALAGYIQGAGYTTVDNFGDLSQPIDPAFKVIFLFLPNTAFSVAEINNMKQFAAEGGRIVFVGEHAGFYGSGIPIENQFFLDMGAQMTNAGGAYDCGEVVEPGSNLRPHQVTNGLTQLTIACASEVIPGPNDYPLLYDLTGTHVLAAVAKIDVTPISPAPSASLRRNRRPAPAVKPNLTVPLGIDPKNPAGKPIAKP